MKLIVMIPCFNEQETLPLVLETIPQKIPGIDKIETLVVDDGSTDKTYQVAKRLKVDHLVRHKWNLGLAKAFETGIEKSLSEKADIIVNTDGDNQYPQKDIPKLIAPILSGEAEIVVADRQTSKIKHFSPIKKFLQRFGSLIVRFLTGADIPDAVSGFRAYSKEAAEQINIVSDFSYVIETIIQASKEKIPISSVKIETNPKTRESRLFKNSWQHVKRSGATIIRIFAMYQPLKVFTSTSLFFFLSGGVIGLRFLYFFFVTGNRSGHVQSLILSAILIITGVQIFLVGLVADLVAKNRKMLEKIIIKNKSPS